MEPSTAGRISASPPLQGVTPSPNTRSREVIALGSNSSTPAPPGRSSTHRPRSNQELKEWCIVYAADCALETTMTTDLKTTFLSSVAVMNTGDNHLDGDRTCALGMDIPTALDIANNEHKRAQYTSAVTRWLVAPKQAVLRAEVEKLMDDELQRFGEPELKDLNLLAKATRIAERRNTKRLYLGSKLALEKELSEKKHLEYEVKLQHLIGGFGGNVNTQTLYFSYNTPFHEFLNALRDATQLATIPPKDVNEERFWRLYESVPDTMDDQEIEITSSSQSSATLTATMSPQADFQSSRNGASKTSSRSVRAQKGYLLSDGAWVYKRQRVHLTNNGKELRMTANTPSPIGNERDYWTMVRLLKEANFAKKAPKPLESEASTSNISASRAIPGGKVDICTPEYDCRYTHGVWIMHRLDYDQHYLWMKKKEREKREDDALRKRWKDEHGEDLGQPYMEWYNENMVNKAANG